MGGQELILEHHCVSAPPPQTRQFLASFYQMVSDIIITPCSQLCPLFFFIHAIVLSSSQENQDVKNITSPTTPLEKKKLLKVSCMHQTALRIFEQQTHEIINFFCINHCRNFNSGCFLLGNLLWRDDGCKFCQTAVIFLLILCILVQKSQVSISFFGKQRANSDNGRRAANDIQYLSNRQCVKM